MENPRNKVLTEAVAFLRETIAPQANQIDQSESALGKALNGLRERKLMALRRPTEYGGPNLNETDFRAFQEEAARASGALAFLQTQHQSAVRMISQYAPEEFKLRYLPRMADELLVGIGFSQLRRPGPPILRATPESGGYRIEGAAPWATGHQFFEKLLIGASLPSGEAVFGLVPFTDTAEETIRYEGPMRLAAMETPRTMSATFNKYLLPESEVAFIQPQGWIERNDMLNVVLQAWFALGCARAGLDVVDRVYQQKKSQFIRHAWERLDTELIECRELISAGTENVADRLATRAWAIDLAVRCGHAAVTCSSGRANSMEHDAQRVYREALVYTVSAQTAEIMEATLNRLVARGSRI